MTARRYYAVVKGWSPEIYTDHILARAQTDGFSGNVMRKFRFLEDAESFMAESNVEDKDNWQYFDEITNFYEGQMIRMCIAGYCEKDGCVDAKAGYAIVDRDETIDSSEKVLPELTHPHTIFCAEYAALLEVLIKASNAESVCISTRNPKLVEQFTVNIHKWRKNGWKACTGYPLVYRSLVKRISQKLKRPYPNVWFELEDKNAQDQHMAEAYQRAIDVVSS
jgi:ribonuclease HI